MPALSLRSEGRVKRGKERVGHSQDSGPDEGTARESAGSSARLRGIRKVSRSLFPFSELSRLGLDPSSATY